MSNLGDSLGFASKLYEDNMIDSMHKSMFLDLIVSRPVKYYIKPIISFKIPYLYFDTDYECDRKGLFLGWHEIEIGKRKIENKNYKEEMKKYKKEKGLVYLVNEKNIKWK